MSSALLLGLAGRATSDLGERKALDGYRAHLPVILFPGFRSCALEVRASFHRPWVDERVWLSVAKLRVFGSGPWAPARDHEDDDTRITEWLSSKNLWVQHVGLNTNHDGFSDPPGITVRPVKGVHGIDFLEPGSFTGRISYVFGYVLKMLKEVGYVEGDNLVAASYDWRLPPCKLEERDRFFSECKASVEMLHKKNHKPVVIASHSMGAKTVHYFLMWARKHAGQEWIDKHVHSMHACAAPWLGVPRAARAVLTGDKMGLENFLSWDDAAYLARSWGSAPFIFPNGLERYTPFSSFVFSRIEGIINVDVVGVTVPQRLASDTDPNKLYVELTFSGTTLRTVGHKASTTDVRFHDHFQLVSSAPFTLTEQDVITLKLKQDEHARAFMLPFSYNRTLGVAHVSVAALLEGKAKGVAHEFTIAVSNELMELAEMTSAIVAGAGTAHPAGQPKYRPDALKSATMPAARPLANSEFAVRVRLSWTEGSGASERRLHTSAAAEDGSGVVQMDFKLNGELSDVRIDPQLLSSASAESLGLLIKQAANEAKDKLLEMTNTFGHQFEPRTLRDIMSDGARDTYRHWEEFYNKDDLYGVNNVALEPPPVKLLRCVYGKNVQTEFMHFYRRKNTRKDRRLACPYVLDEKGLIDGPYTCSRGIVFETPDTAQLSWVSDAGVQIHACGDGLVPYASLHQAAKWNYTHDMEVTVREIEGAEHHSILSNDAYLEDLLEPAPRPRRIETVRRASSFPTVLPGINEPLEADISSLLQYVEQVGLDELPPSSGSLDDPSGAAQPSARRRGPNMDRLMGLFHSSATLVAQAEARRSHVVLTGRLLVAVEGAYDLRVPDETRLMDAYCVVQLGHQGTLRKVARTNVIKKTVNPTWREVFDVPVNGDSVLALKIKDWDPFSQSDTCGRGQYALGPLADGKECAVRVNLRPQGHIILRLRFIAVDGKAVVAPPRVAKRK